MTRNIGLKVNEPKRECEDRNCPFHGGLSIRGKLFDGKVTGNKAKQLLPRRLPLLRWKLIYYMYSKNHNFSLFFQKHAATIHEICRA